QPRPAAQHPVETPADDPTHDDRSHQLRRHAHAVGHAAPLRLRIGARAHLSVPLRPDPAEPVAQLRDPVLELSTLLRAHVPGWAVFVGRIRHDTHVLGGMNLPGAIERERTLQTPPGVSRNAAPRHALDWPYIGYLLPLYSAMRQLDRSFV